MEQNRFTHQPNTKPGGPGVGVPGETYPPPVSVVVPVFNGRGVIAPCIESLRAQTYPSHRYEIIIVDNGSRDGTVDVLREFGDGIRVLHESRRGASSARNTGIRAASHDLLAFIDADCVADALWLRNITAPLVRDATLSVVGGRILTFPCANPIEQFGNRIHDHQKSIEVFTPPYVITMNIALRRSVLDDVGLFDPGFLRAQDTDLSFRLHLRGHRLSYRDDAIILHRNESNLRALFQEGFKHGMWQIRLYRKYSDNLTRNRRRVNIREYKELGQLAADTLRTALRRKPLETDTLCNLVFIAGKKAGHAVGSVRFRHMRF